MHPPVMKRADLILLLHRKNGCHFEQEPSVEWHEKNPRHDHDQRGHDETTTHHQTCRAWKRMARIPLACDWLVVHFVARKSRMNGVAKKIHPCWSREPWYARDKIHRGSSHTWAWCLPDTPRAAMSWVFAPAVANLYIWAIHD